MAYGSSKTGVTNFLDFRLLMPASEDRSGMGDECLGRGVRLSLTFLFQDGPGKMNFNARLY